MAGWDYTPRKQRTRDHIIADQSMNYVERFVFDAGYVARRTSNDNGYDLAVSTFDDQSFVEPDCFSSSSRRRRNSRRDTTVQP